MYSRHGTEDFLDCPVHLANDSLIHDSKGSAFPRDTMDKIDLTDSQSLFHFESIQTSVLDPAEPESVLLSCGDSMAPELREKSKIDITDPYSNDISDNQKLTLGKEQLIDENASLVTIADLPLLELPEIPDQLFGEDLDIPSLEQFLAQGPELDLFEPGNDGVMVPPPADNNGPGDKTVPLARAQTFPLPRTSSPPAAFDQNERLQQNKNAKNGSKKSPLSKRKSGTLRDDSSLDHVNGRANLPLLLRNMPAPVSDQKLLDLHGGNEIDPFNTTAPSPFAITAALPFSNDLLAKKDLTHEKIRTTPPNAACIRTVKSLPSRHWLSPAAAYHAAAASKPGDADVLEWLLNGR